MAGTLQEEVRDLLNNSQWAEAEAKSQRGGLTFELGYALHRQHRNTEAIKLLKGESGTQEKHVLAQALNKEERYGEAAEIYGELVDAAGSKDQQEELACNFLSCCALNADRKAFSKALERVKRLGCESACDVVFNTACVLMQQGKCEEAITILDRCEELCRQSQDVMDWDDLELADEVSRVMAQKACALIRLERRREAQALLDQIMSMEPKTKLAQTLAVTNNNLAVLNQEKDIFDTKKKLRSMQHKATDAKLSSAQKLTARYNNILMDIRSGVTDSALSACEGLRKESPGSIHPFLARASVLARDKKGLAKAEQELRNGLKESPENSDLDMRVRAHLMLGEIALAQDKERTEVVKALKEIPEWQEKLGVVATIAAFLRKTPQADSALEALESAASAAPSPALSAALAVAQAKVDLDRAERTLSQVYSRPAEIIDRASLMSISVPKHHNVVRKEAPASAAPPSAPEGKKPSGQGGPPPAAGSPPPSSAKGKDPKAKEAKGASKEEGSASASARVSGKKQKREDKAEEGATTADEIAAPKPKRKRKAKPAKIMDGNPDPERWKKLKERSYYKKQKAGKGGKGKKGGK